ncbi:MAG: biotin--[acetyl-CoA-carboxylase] ligase [Anaerolineae bacterium]|nr:biotin--[acetyl-CoA-carboxylase] ligase [Anaerolineae bacterium]
MSDGLLTTARLQQVLGGRPFRFDPLVGSTNDLARDWALSGARSGSIVVAEEQTQGRGRFGRVWNAPAGATLLFSVILRPDTAAARLSRVVMVGAVAAADALTELIPGLPDAVNLKWPNDVLLTGRKVAGILPEAIWQGEQLVAVILGIGLNISVDFTGTPLADRAISIETVTQQPVDRAVLLGKLLQGIDGWSALLDDPSLVARWRARLSTVGQCVTVTAADHQMIGLATDVDDDGALLVRTDDGTIHRVIAGEVTLAE